MASTFSYRPKNYSVEQLKKIAQRHHTNLNRYIEEAVTERINNDKLDSAKEPIEQLAKKISKVVVEHLGVQLSKPDKTTHFKINKRFDETSKKGGWVSDKDARPGR